MSIEANSGADSVCAAVGCGRGTPMNRLKMLAILIFPGADHLLEVGSAGEIEHARTAPTRQSAALSGGR